MKISVTTKYISTYSGIVINCYKYSYNTLKGEVR